MWRHAFATIYELALDHYGYVTTTQATAAGVSGGALRMMAHRGELDRVDHGVYRVRAVPPHARDQYAAAVLWPRGDAAFALTSDVRDQLAPHRLVSAVLSHLTALELHDLSDVNPATIHLTLPPTLRVRRAVSRVYVLHHAWLAPDEITVIEGLPVTTVVRTITDCAAVHLGPALLSQAIDQARARGVLRPEDAIALERIVFGRQAAYDRSVA